MKLINIVPVFPSRIDYMLEEAKRLQASAGLDEVALMLPLHPEGHDPYAKVDCYVKCFSIYKEALEGTGIKVGILLQSLIGHGWPGTGTVDEKYHRRITVGGMKKAVNIHGVERRWCMLDPEFRDYISLTITRLAEKYPAFFLVDDDVHLIDVKGTECFCPRHLDLFNLRTGLDCDAVGVRQLVRESQPGDAVFTAFEQIRTNTLLGFVDLIRRAIDVVDPEIRCGYCTPAGEYRLAGEIAHRLAGKTIPLLRINNAAYSQNDATFLVEKMIYTQAFRKYYADIPEVLDETDTFPQHRYATSAAMMHAHITAAIANGVNGAKLWLTNLSWPDNVAEKAYDNTIGRFRHFYSVLEVMVARGKLQGPIIPCYRRFTKWHPGTLFVESFSPAKSWGAVCNAAYGIPFRCEYDANSGLTLIAGDDNAARFSDEEIEKFLAGPLLLDGTAALEFARRGFACDLGVEVESSELRFDFEKECATGVRMRLHNDYECPRLTPNNPTTEVLTELVAEQYFQSQEHTVSAPGATLFRNRRGGSVTVTAMHLKMATYNLVEPVRKQFYLRLLDKLNGSPLPFVALEDQPLYMLHHMLPDGNMLSIFNLSLDSLASIHFRTVDSVRNVKVLTEDGEWLDVRWQQQYNELEVFYPLHACEPAVFNVML